MKACSLDYRQHSSEKHMQNICSFVFFSQEWTTPNDLFFRMQGARPSARRCGASKTWGHHGGAVGSALDALVFLWTGEEGKAHEKGTYVVLYMTFYVMCFYVVVLGVSLVSIYHSWIGTRHPQHSFNVKLLVVLWVICSFYRCWFSIRAVHQEKEDQMREILDKMVLNCIETI